MHNRFRNLPAPTSAKPRPAGRVKAQAFDLGDPIALHCGDAHARVPARPAPTRPGPGRPLARARSVFVEPFEEQAPGGAARELVEPGDESQERTDENERSDEERLGATEEELQEAAKEEEVEPEEEPGEEDQRTSSFGKAGAVRPRAAARAAHAEQVAAFQQEVEAMAARRAAQAAPQAVPAPPEHETAGDAGDNTGPRKRLSHRVFDEMAQGMEYVSEFRLPPVEVTRLFRELDRDIDTGRSAPAAIAIPAVTVPDDRELAADLARLAPPPDPEHASRVLAAQLGTGALRQFAPSELVIGADGALAVFKFFWPESDTTGLGALTDRDRGFAQALLIEAADASHSMGIVETLYRTFFGKAATDFDAVKEMLKEVAKRAIADKWFTQIKTLEDAEKQLIYESVRVTVARNFRVVWDARRQTGELTGY